MNTKYREQKCRRQLNNLGYTLYKSRSRTWKLHDQMGYMIVWNKYNASIAGQDFNLDLDEVEEFIQQELSGEE